MRKKIEKLFFIFFIFALLNTFAAQAWAADTAKAQAYVAKKKGFLDFGGRNEKLKRNGSPDVQFRFHIIVPGKTITNLTIQNIDG